MTHEFLLKKLVKMLVCVALLILYWCGIHVMTIVIKLVYISYMLVMMEQVSDTLMLFRIKIMEFRCGVLINHDIYRVKFEGHRTSQTKRSIRIIISFLLIWYMYIMWHSYVWYTSCEYIYYILIWYSTYTCTSYKDLIERCQNSPIR